MTLSALLWGKCPWGCGAVGQPGAVPSPLCRVCLLVPGRAEPSELRFLETREALALPAGAAVSPTPEPGRGPLPAAPPSLGSPPRER